MIRMLALLAALALSHPAIAQRAELQDAMKKPWQCGLIDSASIAFGTGYVPSVYNNVPLKSDTGSSATAKVTVGAAGAVVDVALTSQGGWYTVGSVLTAATGSLGSTGSGFSLTVRAVHDLAPGYAQARGSGEHRLVARTVGENPCPYPEEERRPR